jgi:hypothetical protein
VERLNDPELLSWLDGRMPEGSTVTGFNHWAGFDNRLGKRLSGS